jgi:hypothetical protein
VSGGSQFAEIDHCRIVGNQVQLEAKQAAKLLGAAEASDQKSFLLEW